MKGLKQSFQNLGSRRIALIFRGVKESFPSGNHCRSGLLTAIFRGVKESFPLQVFGVKKRKYLISGVLALLLVASLLPLASSGSPAVGGEVGGIITEDTTWTKANSPYIVTSSILVTEGVTLTIEAGVTVKFESAKAIQVDGELIARGTEAEPIVFTSNQATPAPGDWGGIVFTDSSVDVTYDEEGNYTSGCIMQYCTVEYGGGDFTPAIKVTSASLFTDHCVVSNNRCTGIAIEYSFLKITNSTVSDNSATYETGGISIYYGAATISNNIITSNSGQYIGGISAAYATTVSISDNIISDNSGKACGGVSPQDCDTVTINGNTITGNSATGGYGGGGISVSDSPAVSINGNIIASNSAGYGGGIDFYNCSGNISNNTIVTNSSDRAGGIYVFGQPTINYNNINNVQDDILYDIYVYGGYGSTIDATKNWWGTDDEAAIQEHIYDWSDDASLGIVNYSPFLTQSVLAPPANLEVESAMGVVELSWEAVSGAIGYKVYYDVDSGFPYEGTGANEGPSPIDVGNQTSFTISGLEMGTRFYFAVTAYNSEAESWYSEEKSVVATEAPPDDTPPSTPVVADDGEYTISLSQLQVSWSAEDPESGIAEYQYAIGTSPGDNDVVDWTSVGIATEATKTDLSLTPGVTYYFAVKAKNGAGLWSEVGVSDGITVIPAIQGKVNLQGRDDHSGAKVEASAVATGMDAMLTLQAITETDGSYAILGLEPGSYQLKLSMSGYLYALHDFEVSLFPDSPLSFDTTLLGGDINGDGIIDVYDLALVGSNFNKTAPQ